LEPFPPEAGQSLNTDAETVLSLRLKDLLGPVTRVKKKKKGPHTVQDPVLTGRRGGGEHR